MKYNVLKDIGVTFTKYDLLVTDANFVASKFWGKENVSIEFLLNEGYIEKITELVKSKYKVGDYVVFTNSDNEIYYIKLFEIKVVEGEWVEYNTNLEGISGIEESKLRRPTNEELEIYFR